MLIAHLDVVEALRSDWSLDPYILTEKDGFFYGRGTSDIKDGAATLAEALLRMNREHIVPKRTLILALTAGEEGGGGYNAMEWLLANHRDLIDAEFALNVDSGDPLIKNGKPLLRALQTSEKIYQSFSLEVTNKGGHSSLPTPDNAIYQLSGALSRLERSPFPVELNDVTRTYFQRRAPLENARCPERSTACRRRRRRPGSLRVRRGRLSAPHRDGRARPSTLSTDRGCGIPRSRPVGTGWRTHCARSSPCHPRWLSTT